MWFQCDFNLITYFVPITTDEMCMILPVPNKIQIDKIISPCMRKSMLSVQ